MQNVRKYLSQVQKLNETIDLKINQKKYLEELSTKATTSFSMISVSGTSSKSRMQDAIERKIDLEADIMRDTLKLANIKKAILNVENETYRKLLWYRYIRGHSWSKIAKKLSIDRQTVSGRLHNMAIKSVEYYIWDLCQKNT